MVSKENLTTKLISLALAAGALGYGLTELGKLDDRHIQQATEKAVEIVKHPENIFKNEKQPLNPENFIDFTQPVIVYDLSPIKPITLEEICKHYSAIEQCKKIAKKEVKDEKAEN